MTIAKRSIVVCGATLLSDPGLAEELGRVFWVVRCHRYEELLQVLKEKSVHVILLEIDSQGDGLEVLRRLKEWYPPIPVLALGGDEPTEMIAQAFKLGARDFFKIPYHRELVVERARAISTVVRDGSA